jgi:alginate O-acetyltransferase complex protein AlgI
MVFSSLIFLFVFFPIVFTFYYLSSKKYRNAVLVFMSSIFYLWGGGSFFFVLAGSILLDFWLGILIERSSPNQKKLLVVLSIILNLFILITFKYSSFFLDEIKPIYLFFGGSDYKWARIILPIGLSFVTFHKISYIVDVYRGVSKALTNFIDYSLYILFFPQLIAGPIIRFHEIKDQIQHRKESLEKLYDGGIRFSWGLIKKVLIANPCGLVADTVFGLNGEVLGTETAWLGIVSYTLQIYFDFSGYSDMAIGLGGMFGFKFPENFNRPYSSVSITDFWRRWHMSLSRFFREYLYIPLGGNQKGEFRTLMNLWIVFVLCGLWHGANWTFLIWGIYHGGLLMAERLWKSRFFDHDRWEWVRRSWTLVLVMIGWVFFRAENVKQAFHFLQSLFVPKINPIPFEVLENLNNRTLFFLGLASIVLFLPRNFSGINFILSKKSVFVRPLIVGVLFLLVFYSIGSITTGSFNPFIYFQF